MLKVLYRSFMMTLVLVLLLCGAYPLAVYGLGQLFFKDKANGGFLERQGQPIGADLIGQAFSRPDYFHGRPSAAGNGYDAANSSGSNLGPTNSKFVEGLKGNIQKVLEENPGLEAKQIPVDLVTASGSGLDPHITPESALIQAERISKARGVSVDTVKSLIEEYKEGPQWGLFGESRVNVLKLNLALDEKTKNK